jgi:hypothetical protein
MNLKKNNLLQIFKSSPRSSTKWSNYFDIYEEIFKKYKDKKITLVEIGIGDGGSLHMWKKYFKKDSRIIGIEMNPDAKKLESDGFEIFIGDQSSKNFWKKFYKKIGKIDILLDDGGHRNIQQITSLVESINYINDKGMIVIEDTHSSYMKKGGFGNPSKYSFINFCTILIENIHRRNPMVKKINNKFSDKIHSLCFYDSVATINVSSQIVKKTHNLVNKKNEPVFFVDYRNRGYFIKTISLYKKIFGNLDENTLIFKILRKTFHRNIFFYIHEKLKLKRYFNDYKK